MKRSKSTSQPKNKRMNKSNSKPLTKKRQKVLAIATENTAFSPPHTDRHCMHLQQDQTNQPSKTLRNGLEQRLLNIRKGFETLEKNLNQYTPEESMVPSPNRPTTQRRIAKKLYETESHQKCNTHRKSTTVLKNKRSPSRKAKNPQKYHTCIYEKSLYDLMKIVTLQREQISKLNNKIRRNKL